MDTITREPTTVGEMLTKEFYDHPQIAPERLSEALGVSIGDVEQLMQGKRRLSAAEAAALGDLFGMGAEFWLNLQTAHDRWEERKASLDAEFDTLHARHEPAFKALEDK